MKKWLCAITCSLTILSTPSLIADAETVLISYENPQDTKTLEQILENSSYELFPTPQLMTATVSAETKAALEKLPLQVTIEEDEHMTVLEEKSAASLWNIQALSIPIAWNKNYTGKGVKIAVIDTGINAVASLPNVKKRVSFVKDDPKTAINESDNVDRGYNDQGHGTLVASIIGSQMHTQMMVQGVAPNAEIYALKYADGTQGGVASKIVKAINWSIENDMDIINISSGLKTDLTALHKVIKEATAKGILVVASAGNDGQSEKTRFPARYSEVISVGSINKYGDLSSFSNNMNGINFVAPGEEILAINRLGQVHTVNGTSFSAPHITALLALYKERFPYSKTKTILNYVKKSAKQTNIPRFDVPAFKRVESTVSVTKKTVKDHQINVNLNYSALSPQEQAVILVDKKIIGYTTANQYSLKNLSANKKHQIEVRQLDAFGNWSEASTLMVKTLKDVTPPAAPTDFEAIIQNEGHVKLAWKQKMPADFAKTTIYENGVKLATTTEKSYTPKKTLKLNTHYTYKIVAVDTTGNRSKAKELSIIRYK